MDLNQILEGKTNLVKQFSEILLAAFSINLFLKADKVLFSRLFSSQGDLGLRNVARTGLYPFILMIVLSLTLH